MTSYRRDIAVTVMGSGHGLGGLQTHFHELIEFLCDEECRVSCVIVGDSESVGLRVCPKYRISIPHTGGSASGAIGKWLAFERAYRHVRSFSPQLFIAAASGNAYATMARRLRGKAFSFYQEVITPIPYRDPRCLRLVESFDAVAVQSASMVERYIHSMGTQKNVVDVPCFSREMKVEKLAELPSEGQPVKLVYVGRLAANKGLTEFLTAFAQVCEAQNLTFGIHGDGPEKPALMLKLRSLGLERRVTLHGKFSNDALPDILTQSHTLVLPSVASEGLPLILLEAMSCGLSWIATDIGAIRDAALDNPDVTLISPKSTALRAGVECHLGKLREQSIRPSRLQAYYHDRFSNQSVKTIWRSLLTDPRAFFNRENCSS